MKLRHHLGCWLCACVVAGCTACGVPGPPKPPSLNLPQPVSDLRAVRKGDSVFLSWTIPTRATDSAAVRRMGVTRVCRSNGQQIMDCPSTIGEIAAPAATSTAQPGSPRARYTDTLPKALLSDDPSLRIWYAVSVANANGRSAGLSNIVTVPALPAPPPPTDFRVQVTADGVLLSWSGSAQSNGTTPVRHIYRVYRREEGKTTDTVVGEMPFGKLRSYLLLDHSFEWEKTYFYRATVVTSLHATGQRELQFESEDTAQVKVLVHDTFPPAAPSGLQAVFSGAGQQPFVDLSWAPDTDADLAGYNIYRREGDGELSKINSELVKTPAFRDSKVVSRHTYLYAVSAVDAHGNESPHSTEASEEVP